MYTLIAADYLGDSSLSLRETNDEQKQQGAVRLNMEQTICVYRSSGLFAGNGYLNPTSPAKPLHLLVTERLLSWTALVGPADLPLLLQSL